MAGRRFIATDTPIKWPKGSMRYRFVANLRRRTSRLFTGSTAPHKDLAKLLGVSPDLAGKYLRGDRVPDMEQWAELASKLGMKRWSDLFSAAE